MPNIGQKPLATDATGPFPGSHISHCIFSSKASGFENTTNTGEIKGGGILGRRPFLNTGGMIQLSKGDVGIETSKETSGFGG
ncbi:hypothetical protein ACFLZM_07100, partial [Thermodesulfobacteriota bacterium]